MKKLVYTLLAAVFFVPACQKVSKETLSDETPSKDVKTSITVGIEASSTKTDLSGTVDFVWAAGDAISIDTEASGYKTFTLEGAGGVSKGTFSINEDVTIRSGDDGAQAFYPATLNPTWNGEDSKTHVTLPASYTWADQSVKAPMYAWLNKTSPWDYFSLMTSVIKVDIYNIPAAASKLVFTSAGEVVSGDFAFPYDCIPVVTGTENKTITINFTAGEETNRTFFIPVPYGTYSAGATFVLKNSSDEALVSKTAPAITVAKASIAYFPAINCDAVSVTNIITDALDCSAWGNWNQKNGLSLGSVKAGDRLRFNVTELTADSYWQLKPQYAGEGWAWTLFEGVNYGLTSGQTSLDVIVNDAMVAAFKERPSLTVQGYNVTVNSVQHIPQTEVVLWKGSHDLGDWDNCFDVNGLNSAAMWSNLKAGKELAIYFNEGTSPDINYCQFFIQKKTGGDTILSFNGGNNHNQTVYTYTLTADQVTAIKESGIVIWGKRIVINKITLR